jgi:D-beta-D-heptose 7-phosphate kinase/D-beta-D-heptose 1-phosphate adenosyltransferase
MDFSNLKVLVVGDICLDVIEQGESTRLAPECPVPVIKNPSRIYSLGMAGRTAWNLKSLGADVTISSWTRVDKDGKKIFDLMDLIGIKQRRKYYSSEKNIRNSVKKRIFANNHQVDRIDKENTDIVEDALLNSMKENFDFDTNEFDLIIISDYNKGFICKETWSIMRPVLEKCNKGDFFVDTKKLDVLDYYEGMYLFPNDKEMNALLAHNNCITRTELRKELDTDFIVETKGNDGAIMYKEDGKLIIAPTYKTNVIDTYGAGDTFIAAFSLYYTKFKNKVRALEFANYCCSKVVQRLGCTPVELNEVLDFEVKK